MAIVGPGAVQDNLAAPLPALEGASEFEFVTILNPLTDDFAVRVALDIPVNMPFNIGKDTSGKVSQMTNTEADARQIYGLNLKNPDFVGRKHIVNDTIIKAGETINLKGNEAQVAVRQLTNEILQREGNKRLMADPNLRAEVEKRIIIRRGSVQSLMDGQFNTVQQQATDAINKSNETQYEAATEQPFAGVIESEEGAGSDQSANPAQERRSPGRPKKA